MYHVHAKEQGDAQPGVFHRQLLHVAYLGYSFQVEMGWAKEKRPGIAPRALDIGL